MVLKNKINTMAEEEVKPIEVAVPETKPGTVQFMNKSAFNNPAPEKLKKVMNAIIQFCAGLTTAVGATDLFTGRQPKVIMFVLGVVMIACGSIKAAVGVKPADEK